MRALLPLLLVGCMAPRPASPRPVSPRAELAGLRGELHDWASAHARADVNMAVLSEDFLGGRLHQPSFSQELLVPLGDGGLYLVVVGESLAIGLVDAHHHLVDAWAHPALLGYTLIAAPSGSADPAIVVVRHEHPGTGMTYSYPMRVTVDDGRLVVRDLDDAELQAFLAPALDASKQP